MVNTITLISLLKPTFIFLCNRRRLVYLLTIPFPVLTAVMILTVFFPPVFLAETIRPTLKINFYTVFLIAGSFGFFIPAVMLRAQQLLFFEENGPEKRFFLPKFDGSFWRYLSACFGITFYALILSALLTFVFIAALRSFLPVEETTGYFVIVGSVLFFPYFFVRFIMKIPSAAAGRPLRLLDAWKMTRSISITLVLLFVMFLFVPTAMIASLGKVIQSIVGIEATSLFVNSFGVVFVFLVSALLLSTYCGYLFSQISSKD